MLAFHAPPDALTSWPSTNGNIAGRSNRRQRSTKPNPLTCTPREGRWESPSRRAQAFDERRGKVDRQRPEQALLIFERNAHKSFRGAGRIEPSEERDSG